jgi:hypothetical protein
MKTLLVSIVLFLSLTVSAQNAVEIRTKYNKVDVPAVEASFDYSKELVDKALSDYLIQNFKKKKSSRGYDLYENAFWPAVAEQPISVFTRVTGGKNSSTITMLISTASMAFYSSTDNKTYIDNLKVFLNGFGTELAKAQLNQNINEQTDEVKKVEDKISKNLKEANRLKSDKEKLEKDIVNNAKELEELNKKLQEEKNKLEKVKN